MTSGPGRITVALDAEHMRQSVAGVARYAAGLAAALRKRSDTTVIELGGGDIVPRGSVRKRAITARQDFLWYPWLARRRARKAGADIYHVPFPRGPVTRGKPPFVVTVHDLVQLRYPETMTPWSRIYSRLALRRTLDSADLIIASSMNTADDLTSLVSMSPDRIRVIHIGIDECFFEPAAESIVTGPYVLFVGTPEPRKNLDRLVTAMAELRRRGAPHRLVIAGGAGWGTAVVEAPHVDRLGRVSETDLCALYAHASCVALPSLHEGFGLPALEAMAAGTPVVAGRAGALPEITGGAAVLVDPLDVSDIADGIERCISDGASLVTAGRERARHFSWERAASETVAAYREVM